MNTTDKVRVREVPIEKVAISVEEASALLGIAKPTLYKLIKDGSFTPVYKIGNRTVVSVEGLREWDREQRRNAIII